MNEVDGGRKRPGMVKAAETLIIENRLRECVVGETVTYDELSRLLGRDVRAYSEGHLRIARKSLTHERIVFDVVRDVGLIRMDDVAKAKASAAAFKSVRQRTKKAIGFTAAIENFDALPVEYRNQALASQSIGACILDMTTNKSVAKVVGAIQNNALPVGKTLDLFRSGSKQ